MSIILASQSPRRKQLLEWAEIPFEIIVKNTDESYPPHLQIKDIPIFIAKEKALAVKQLITENKEAHLNEKTILAADTVVLLENEIIGKPKDRNDAIEILQKLVGKTHAVITGVYILSVNNEVAFSDITYVTFRHLSEEQIAFYVDKYQPFDKAGAYAIQEWIGVVGIEKIEGDFYNVMGLPVSKVVLELNKLDH